jgi:hypothetical protein
MAKTADEIIFEDISGRLNKIASHFERREELRRELLNYRQGDYTPKSAKGKDVSALAGKIQTTESSILHELVHLLDNVRTYYKHNGLSEKELSVIEMFRPYRVAANFANIQKHGSRGRGKTSSRTDFYALVCKKPKEADATMSDQIVDIQSMINFDGTVWEVMDIADSLVRLWELFLRHHTSINVTEFVTRIQKIMPPGLHRFSIALSDIPKGLVNHAKKLDQERKSLNL